MKDISINNVIKSSIQGAPLWEDRSVKTHKSLFSVSAGKGLFVDKGRSQSPCKSRGLMQRSTHARPDFQRKSEGSPICGRWGLPSRADVRRDLLQMGEGISGRCRSTAAGDGKDDLLESRLWGL